MSNLDTTNFRDKDSKRPEYRELYERLPFIEAYSKHTDMRIMADGPELAIGAKRDGAQDWDIHGNMQLNFLIGRGLLPHNSLLDIGCGTGRLACKAVPYMNEARYTGIDISTEAVNACYTLANKDGWVTKDPLFIIGDGTLRWLPKDESLNSGYDVIWAHSVVTHLPADVVNKLFEDISGLKFKEMYFTYKQSTVNVRTGLKQFSYDPSSLIGMANKNRMHALPEEYMFPAGQHVMKLWKV